MLPDAFSANLRKYGLLAILAAAILLTAAIWFGASLNSDFHAYYEAATSLLQGRTDLYAPDFTSEAIQGYRYPPVFLFAIVPLALLPFALAASIFLFVSVLLAFVAIERVLRTLPLGIVSRTSIFLVLILPVLLTSRYTLLTLRYGNVHVIVVSLLILAFYLATRQRAVWASLLFAAATSIKVFPLLILPYFAIRRQWRFVLLTVAFTAVLNLLPALYFGFRENNELLAQWYSAVVVESAEFSGAGPLNLSLRGQMARYLTDFSYYRSETDGYPAVNFAHLDPATLDRLYYVCAVLVIGGTFGLIYYRRRGSTEPFTLDLRTTAEFGLVFCMTLIVGPRTNVTFLSAIWLPLTVFFALFITERKASDLPFAIAIVFLGVIIPLAPGAARHRFLAVVGVDLLFTFAVAGGLATHLWRRPPDILENHE